MTTFGSPVPHGVLLPGWYPDPSGCHRLRWHDGVDWTTHVTRPRRSRRVTWTWTVLALVVLWPIGLVALCLAIVAEQAERRGDTDLVDKYRMNANVVGAVAIAIGILLLALALLFLQFVRHIH